MGSVRNLHRFYVDWVLFGCPGNGSNVAWRILLCPISAKFRVSCGHIRDMVSGNRCGMMEYKGDPAQAADKVANYLSGTCMSLEKALEQCDLPEDLNMNSDFCTRLDSIVFQCACCEWWFEIGEMSASVDWTCEECA